jgi:acetolactate synthase I/II/III large subunit
VIADKIAEWLESKGITHAFGIIGGGNHVLWNAIVERGFTQIVSVHHEQAAVMAAAYYYRTCGKIAVAMVTTGGGSTNALTGVMAAYMDRVPVLVISGNEASKYMDAETRVWGVQGYDSSGAAKKVCKRGERLYNPAAVEVVLQDNLRIALEAPQGPVWIDIPKDVQSAV